MRFRTQVKILEKAEALLDERGIEVQPVALKFLVPWFGGASIEDEGDECMARRWATLLANAAAGEGGNEVLPSYAAILSELTSREAELVEWLYRPYVDKGLQSPKRDGRGVEEILHSMGLAGDLPAFIVVAENAMRLGLCDRAWRSEGANLGGAGADMHHAYERLLPTQFGLAFVRACTVPPLASTSTS